MADALPAELRKVDPAAAWAGWEPSAAAPWDAKAVAHLYRRAAFGPSPADTARALADGFPRTLDRLMAGEPGAAAATDFIVDTGSVYHEPAGLRAWWLYLMYESGHPVREKLTLFWHHHFATSYAKVRNTHRMREQNLALRTHALGKFRPLLLAMSRDTAMLVWLDSNRNVKGAPNENYAREVMELFSLGVGNYTEKDVREAARAFTGWHHDPEVKGFEFNADVHDAGPKTLFGRTGNWGGEDVVRLCGDHPACARFLVAKLYGFLVSETPPPKGLLAPLEDRFRRSDYDIADLVRTMVGSRLFFSAHAYRKRVKWPVEYVLGACRAVVPARHPKPNGDPGDWVPPADLVDPLAKMGQQLFAPPNVKGWRTGTDWLNTATLLARNNFAESVAMGTWPNYREEADGSTTTAVTKPAPKAAKVDATDPPPAPPPPPPRNIFDVTAVVLAARPATWAEAVDRMGELLYGEPVAPAAAGKVTAFLAAGGAPKDWAAPATRQRLREALHALMCLPEYQLC